MWEIEPINVYHCLFVRVHKDKLSKDKNEPNKSAFSNTPITGDNLSSDWCKYASAITSRELISKQKNGKGEYKNPSDFYIWQFNIINLIQLDVPQKVAHEPFYNDPEIDGKPNNRAHSIIIGEKPNEAEFRVKMHRAGSWAIPPL